MQMRGSLGEPPGAFGSRCHRPIAQPSAVLRITGSIGCCVMHSILISMSSDAYSDYNTFNLSTLEVLLTISRQRIERERVLDT